MTWIFMMVGILLNLIVLRDMFHTLLAPGGRGSMSSGISRVIWSVFHIVARRKPHRLNLAGPLAVLTIIAVWTLGITVGWACALWPHLPDEFLLSTGMDPDHNGGFLDAIYVSLVALTTLGYGEITPQTTWIRLVAPLEALIGFSLLTASISWVMSIHPALSRRRTLARNVFVLQRSQSASGISISDLDADAACELLQGSTTQVVAVRDDFSQIPITYYFRTSDPEASLDVAVPMLLSLARTAAHDPVPAVRLHGNMLLGAIQQLTDHLSRTWLQGGENSDMAKTLEAYATDHLRDTSEDGRSVPPAE